MNTKSFVDTVIADDEFDQEIQVMWEDGEILSGWYVAKQRRAAAERQARFDQARKTGQRVLLYQYSDECDGTADDDCDIDSVYVYAMPNGTEKTERSHSY